MPQWIHDRAKHLQEKNPDMPASTAFAIATQQSHATGHSPKGYGTASGRKKAKEKYKTPDDDEQRANPKEAAVKEMMDRMKAKYDELFKVANTTSEVETKGSLETNIGDTQKGTNHVQFGPGEQKGVPAEGNMWGQDPPADKPAIGKRSPTHETLSEAGEKINVENGHDLLNRVFTNMPAASDVAKKTIEQNFLHGRRGTYVTRSMTLLEKVRSVAGRD